MSCCQRLPLVSPYSSDTIQENRSPFLKLVREWSLDLPYWITYKTIPILKLARAALEGELLKTPLDGPQHRDLHEEIYACDTLIEKIKLKYWNTTSPPCAPSLTLFDEEPPTPVRVPHAGQGPFYQRADSDAWSNEHSNPCHVASLDLVDPWKECNEDLQDAQAVEELLFLKQESVSVEDHKSTQLFSTSFRPLILLLLIYCAVSLSLRIFQDAISLVKI